MGTWNKNILKSVSLGLFLIGFLLFNALLFMGQFKLTEELVRKAIPDERKATLFLSLSGSQSEQGFSTSWALTQALNSIFEQFNQHQIEKYGIRPEEVKRFWNSYTSPLGEEDFRSVFVGKDEAMAFKEKTLLEYAKPYMGKEIQHKDIDRMVSNLHAYALIPRYGLDRYARKDITYALARGGLSHPILNQAWAWIFITLGLCVISGIMWAAEGIQKKTGQAYQGTFFDSLKNRGWLGKALAAWLLAFYVFLYFYPEHIVPWIGLVDPISLWINGNPAGRFFLYGFLYTGIVFLLGLRMAIVHRHDRYQVIRSLSLVFFQTCFAFLLPELLVRLNQPYFDFKNIWPLDYDFFFDYELNALLNHGGIGLFMLAWGIALSLIGVPVLTYFFGKRWYCSWVCGCGGLAETLGDPFRQLSDKSIGAWKVERWSIHVVLAFAVAMTGGVLYTYFTGASSLLFIDTYTLREVYGFFIGAIFAGVIGTGLYPLMGSRTWCRFGCPLAAYLGLVQRFRSRYRISVNGGQCISCGNCSTYCEMGIDVRWYAQRGQDIVRSSCVGCGICSNICPRGVLNLETKSIKAD